MFISISSLRLIKYFSEIFSVSSEIGVKMQESAVHWRTAQYRNTISVCSTCLSTERELFSLENSPQLLQICNGLILSPKDMVCYECQARLQNVLKFRNCALRAKRLLSSLALRKLTEMPNLKCLSTLTQVVVPLDDKICQNGDLVVVKEETPEPLEKIELVGEPMFVSADENMKTEEYLVPEDDFESEAKSASAHDSSRTETASEDDEVEVAVNQPVHAEDFVEREISHEEVLAYMARERNSHRFKSGRYKCHECAIVFCSSLKFWRSHILRHAETAGPFVCSVCEQRFASKLALRLHTAAHYKRYDCQKCNCTEYDYKRMRQHYLKKHDRSPRFCSRCSERFTSYADMLQHKRTAHATEYTCEHCCCVFSANFKLQNHLQRKHVTVPLVECDECHKQFKGQYNLHIHRRKAHSKEPSSPNENAYCAECNIQFKDIYQYKAHINNTSRHVAASAFRYECDYCGKKFVQKQYVSHHIELMHLKLAKYKCDVCNQSFPTSVYRNRHKRLKHADKPRKKFVCHICGKAFSVRKSLDEHTNSHLGLRPFVCKHCGATFTYSAALYTHNQLVHLKRKRGNPKTNKRKIVG